MFKLVITLAKIGIVIYLIIQGIIWLRNPDMQIMGAIYWVGGIILAWMPSNE